jgi:cation:H+ antiporter
MLLSIAAVVVGFVLLLWGADRFVTGAAALARNLGVRPLFIGLTIVGFATSTPEILVSGMAAVQGNPGLAIGNAIGSNIANIGLILGVTALVAPLVVDSDILRKEYPVLLIVSVGAWAILGDGYLGRFDGILLLLGLAMTLFVLVRIGLTRGAGDPLLDEYDAEIPRDLGTASAARLFLVSLLVLLGSSRLMVWGAADLARMVGVSDLVIGLTVVAIGTSLPELAASIASALKKDYDLAIGNVIGSNLYNMLAVLSLPGILAPGEVAADAISRDLPVMLVLTAALYVMGHGFGRQGQINRIEGITLVASFIAFQAWVLVDTLPAVRP